MKKQTFFVFFSNKLERLADLLQEQLFSSGQPIQRRFIVVPDGRIKTYLYQQFALRSHAKIAFGLEIVTLPEALHELTKKEKKKDPFYFPTGLDLSVGIESILVDLYLSDRIDPAYALLYEYLGKKEAVISQPLRRKILSLSQEMSRFFSILGLQPMTVIEEWAGQQGWQQRIWQSLFSNNPLWSYPERILRYATPCMEKISLFGFSYLPSVYLQFFQKIEVSAYLLSPSEFFWEDLYSDQERVFLQKVLEGKKIRLKVRKQLDFYLRESNPLLGNWGKLGREFIRQLGHIEPYIEEFYSPYQANTLLARVQNDFLHLGQGEYEESLRDHDGSLEIHGCTSKMREVEVFLEKVQQIMASNHSIEPKDILILSPHLDDYIPYIHQVLALSSIDYKVIESREKSQEDLLSAIAHLLSLIEKRFEPSVVIELFSFTPFLHKQGWKQEEVVKLSRWVEKVSIQWGVNKQNRIDILSKTVGTIEDPSDCGTWIYGLKRLLAGLVFSRTEEEGVEGFDFPWPSYCIDWSESEFLGQVITVMESLYQDIKKMEHLQVSFAEGICYLQEMLQRYFVCEKENSFIQECQKIGGAAGQMQTPFAIESFKRILQSLLMTKKTTYQNSLLQAITFAPLKIGGMIPSKVIYLLGMDEGSFPRQEIRLLMSDVGAIKKGGYLPSKNDEDRYLFLEAILCCREYLMISYCRISAEDHKLQTASVVVEELITYIKSKYPKQYQSSMLYSHPALSFHDSYFAPEAVFTPLSSHVHRASQSYYGKAKRVLPPFFPTFYGKGSLQISPEVETISIQELLKFAKNPIKFFFQDVLDMYFPSLFQEDCPEFLLAGYEKAQIRKDAVKRDWSGVINVAKAKGSLPLGLFEQIATKKIEQEQQQLLQQSAQWGLLSEEIHSISLQVSCRHIQRSKGKITIPALAITGPQGNRFIIEGTLSEVSEKGILFHVDNTVKDLMSIWPAYLIYLQVARCLERKETAMYALKKPEKMQFVIEEGEEILGSYLEFFHSCKASPSFLMPAWSSWILQSEEKEFVRAMKQKAFVDTSPFPDDYLRWLFLRDPSPSVEGLYALQQRIDPRVFSSLF
ncbi:MAG: exodeoxyribonuclease V subunit gamma [Chlamydiae bacterium]|nr:exodeoxyribonuclease V subunit gamma [Chlamydiota bacterium]